MKRMKEGNVRLERQGRDERRWVGLGVTGVEGGRVRQELGPPVMLLMHMPFPIETCNEA